MKQKPLLSIVVVYLLASAIYLLSPGEGAWAVPGQNPHRQSSPTRTPTPGVMSTPVGTPGVSGEREAGATPVPPPQGNLSLPSTTVTPLFLTLFPPTAAPIATWEVEVGELETGQSRDVPTRQPPPVPLAGGSVTPSWTPPVDGTAVPMPPGDLAFSGGALGASAVLDCAVMGGGLVLLSIGLILVGRRRQ